ncbi:MAG: uncharacterized protein KVP18_004627 [Porospora cf. gigantea A]|uniref:uncharacterized protein n=1 Tax=Porospora cf. gigantea A TaxID=2853593 RepID=UPI00355AA92D|nr:MAG: hypothetical protein KVP18_004627 [Porospora cf. gigantea A]
MYPLILSGILELLKDPIIEVRGMAVKCINRLCPCIAEVDQKVLVRKLASLLADDDLRVTACLVLQDLVRLEGSMPTSPLIQTLMPALEDLSAGSRETNYAIIDVLADLLTCRGSRDLWCTSWVEWSQNRVLNYAATPQLSGLAYGRLLKLLRGLGGVAHHVCATATLQAIGDCRLRAAFVKGAAPFLHRDLREHLINDALTVLEEPTDDIRPYLDMLHALVCGHSVHVGKVKCFIELVAARVVNDDERSPCSVEEEAVDEFNDDFAFEADFGSTDSVESANPRQTIQAMVSFLCNMSCCGLLDPRHLEHFAPLLSGPNEADYAPLVVGLLRPSAALNSGQHPWIWSPQSLRAGTTAPVVPADFMSALAAFIREDRESSFNVLLAMSAVDPLAFASLLTPEVLTDLFSCLELNIQKWHKLLPLLENALSDVSSLPASTRCDLLRFGLLRVQHMDANATQTLIVRPLETLDSVPDDIQRLVASILTEGTLPLEIHFSLVPALLRVAEVCPTGATRLLFDDPELRLAGVFDLVYERCPREAEALINALAADPGARQVQWMRMLVSLLSKDGLPANLHPSLVSVLASLMESPEELDDKQSHIALFQGWDWWSLLDPVSALTALGNWILRPNPRIREMRTVSHLVRPRVNASVLMEWFESLEVTPSTNIAFAGRVIAAMLPEDVWPDLVKVNHDLLAAVCLNLPERRPLPSDIYPSANRHYGALVRYQGRSVHLCARATAGWLLAGPPAACALPIVNPDLLTEDEAEMVAIWAASHGATLDQVQDHTTDLAPVALQLLRLKAVLGAVAVDLVCTWLPGLPLLPDVGKWDERFLCRLSLLKALAGEPATLRFLQYDAPLNAHELLPVIRECLQCDSWRVIDMGKFQVQRDDLLDLHLDLVALVSVLVARGCLYAPEVTEIMAGTSTFLLRTDGPPIIEAALDAVISAVTAVDIDPLQPASVNAVLSHIKQGADTAGSYMDKRRLTEKFQQADFAQNEPTAHAQITTLRRMLQVHAVVLRYAQDRGYQVANSVQDIKTSRLSRLLLGS